MPSETGQNNVIIPRKSGYPPRKSTVLNIRLVIGYSGARIRAPIYCMALCILVVGGSGVRSLRVVRRPQLLAHCSTPEPQYCTLSPESDNNVIGHDIAHGPTVKFCSIGTVILEECHTIEAIY